MTNLIAVIDTQAASLPVLLRIILWGLVSGTLSMMLYAKISPQQKILFLKRQQKVARSALIHHDGDWATLQTRIKHDLNLSLKLVGMIFLPFAIVMAPLMVLIYYLSDYYGNKTYSDFGPYWMQGFDFWYVAALMLISLAIKLFFRIA